jgi:OOP family OmpA-OmpF porin
MRTVSGTQAIDGRDGDLTDNLVSVGVQYDFGATKLYSEDDDSDGDGVLDIWDDCPDTEPGVDVSSRGCPLRDLRSDADGDRVPDDIDGCPNTPVGDVVDAYGCSIDSDGDGVVTGRDRCPASRPGAQVDSFGCERDNDQDGVVDHLDSCLNTRPGVRVDTSGCEITDIIELTGVNFETGSDRVVAGVEEILRKYADTLNKYPELEIEVAGHTDSVGLGDANYGLSERRAVTVRDILIRFGVEEFRIRATGYGESQPIADNDTAEGRARNRRVELRILNQ